MGTSKLGREQVLHYLLRAVRKHGAQPSAQPFARTGTAVERRPAGESRRNGEIGLALQSALADLPDEQREIMILRVWGQMTFEEAAAALDISPNTAASRYRYALSKLNDTRQPLAKEKVWIGRTTSSNATCGNFGCASRSRCRGIRVQAQTKPRRPRNQHPRRLRTMHRR